MVADNPESSTAELEQRVRHYANRGPQNARLECVDLSNLFSIIAAAVLAMMLIAGSGDFAVAAPPTESITGFVYYEDGVTPLSEARVSAYDSVTGNRVNYNRTAPVSGNYYINLPSGRYRLMAETPGYVTQWYSGVAAYDSATSVSVSGLDEIPGINFTLRTPLEVTTGTAAILTGTSARLYGNLESQGIASSVAVSFEWGTVAGGPYPHETSSKTRTGTGAFFAEMSGLADGTNYCYRAKAVGDSTVYGDEESFTIDASAPVISSVEAFNIAVSGAIITWTTNEPATSQVQYGLTKDYGSYTTWDSNLVTGHSVDLTDLEPGKTYHYRVPSKDAANNQSVSADSTFKTTARSGSGMLAWAWGLIGLGAIGRRRGWGLPHLQEGGEVAGDKGNGIVNRVETCVCTFGDLGCHLDREWEGSIL
jgi:hypothetical protein